MLIASYAKPFRVTITLVTYILSDQETCVQIENSNNKIMQVHGAHTTHCDLIKGE